jgi:uncharacterized membrane protein YesL
MVPGLTQMSMRSTLALMGPLLATIYKKFFWNTYDNIARLLLVNLFWFLIFPVPTFLCFRYLPVPFLPRLGITIALGLLTNAFAQAGVFGVAARIADYRQISLRHFIAFAKTFCLRTLALSLIFGAIFFLIFESIRFYIALKPGGGILGFFLAGIQIWILTFCLLMQVYMMPLLAAKAWNLKRVLKWSAMLVVLKPGFTILIFLQALAIFVLVAITGVGAVLLALSLVSVFLSTSLREMLKEMEAQTEPKKKATSWKEIFAERDRRDEEPRTFKDLFRPWDT